MDERVLGWCSGLPRRLQTFEALRENVAKILERWTGEQGFPGMHAPPSPALNRGRRAGRLRGPHSAGLGASPRVQFPQWRPEPSASQDPSFQWVNEQLADLGARVPARNFSHGKKRPETLLWGLFKRQGPRFLARGREGERGREVWGGGAWCRGFKSL